MYVRYEAINNFSVYKGPPIIRPRGFTMGLFNGRQSELRYLQGIIKYV